MKLISVIGHISRSINFPGKERILRYFYSPDRKNRNSTSFLVKYNGDSLINIDTTSFIEWKIFFFGYYEPDIIKIFKKHIKKGDIVVDVGANIGAHTLVLSKLVGGGKVFAFEPHPQIADRLKKNLEVNNISNVKVFETAASDTEGRITFYGVNSNDSNKGKSSIYKEHVGNSSEAFDVEVNTLDNVARDNSWENVSFIKIDTEGNDLKVIFGAEKIISHFKPSILFEYSKEAWAMSGLTLDDAQKFFNKHNYNLIDADNISLTDISANYRNILATPN